MAGRRTSDRAKNLAGTARQDRRPPPATGFRLRTVPPPPPGMSRSARKHWQRVGELAVGAGVLCARDLAALRLCAEALATAETAERILRRDGLVLTSRGAKKAHPAVGVLRDARALALRGLIELGLTPRSRGAVDSMPIGGGSAGGDDQVGNNRYFREADAKGGSKWFRDDEEDLGTYLATNPSRGRA